MWLLIVDLLAAYAESLPTLSMAVRDLACSLSACCKSQTGRVRGNASKPVTVIARTRQASTSWRLPPQRRRRAFPAPARRR